MRVHQHGCRRRIEHAGRIQIGLDVGLRAGEVLEHRLDVGEHLARHVVPHLHLLVHGTADDVAEGGRQQLVGNVDGTVRALGDVDVELLRACDHGATEQHLPHDQPERIDVGGVGDGLAADLLRRHVARRAEEGAGLGQIGLGLLHQFGEAEVEHLHHLAEHPAVVEEDVGRLDVAVNHAEAVRLLQGLEHLQAESAGLRPGEGAVTPDLRLQRLTREQGEHQKRHVVFGVAVVEQRDHVRMLELHHQLGLAREADLLVVAVGMLGVHQLDGDLLLHADLLRAIHGGASAHSDGLDDRVLFGHDLARLQRRVGHSQHLVLGTPFGASPPRVLGVPVHRRLI